MSILRRLRGVAGTALTWAAGWSVVGGVLHGVFSLFGWNGFLVPSFGVEVLTHAMMGFVAGTMFSAGLLISERRRSLRELSLSRSAVWGALAGLVGPVLLFFLGGDLTLLTISTTWPFFVGTTVFGAASGGGMAALARGDDINALGPRDEAPALNGEISGVG